MFVHFQGRLVFCNDRFDLHSSWDNGTQVERAQIQSQTATDQTQFCRTTWLQESSMTEGWHTVEHRAGVLGGNSLQLVFDQTELIVLAAYA